MSDGMGSHVPKLVGSTKRSRQAMTCNMTKSVDAGLNKLANRMGFATCGDFISDVFEKEWVKIINPLSDMTAKERLLYHIEKIPNARE